MESLIFFVIDSVGTTIINLSIRFNIAFDSAKFMADSEYSKIQINPILISGRELISDLPSLNIHATSTGPPPRSYYTK
jgi:hypothetical protein